MNTRRLNTIGGRSGTPDPAAFFKDWLPAEDYVHRPCGTPALMNPADSREWGCPTCAGTTHAIVVNFRETNGWPKAA